MKTLILVFIGVFLIGFLEASKDTIDHHFDRSVFKNFGSYFKNDWTRKYEKDEGGNLLLDENGKYIHKTWKIPFVVPGSSNILSIIKIKQHPAVFDFWHLCKVLLYGLVVYIAAYRKEQSQTIIIIKALLYGILYNLSFNLFYDVVLLL